MLFYQTTEFIKEGEFLLPSKMKKEEVELIILKVSFNGAVALNMKIYKDGTTCRIGNGGMPQLGISGMSFYEDSRFFDPLLEMVPLSILQKPINYQEEHTPNGMLEYVIVFYGASSNGETGERANWTKYTGIRMGVDRQTQLSHPILSFVDNFAFTAAELTNDWYFDIIISAVFQMKSSTLPGQTVIGQPKTREELSNSFSSYLSQVKQNARGWNLLDYSKNKTFENRKKQSFKINIQEEGGNFNISFDEA